MQDPHPAVRAYFEFYASWEGADDVAWQTETKIVCDYLRRLPDNVEYRVLCDDSATENDTHELLQAAHDRFKMTDFRENFLTENGYGTVSMSTDRQELAVHWTWAGSENVSAIDNFIVRKDWS